jgi:hypothetical protein
MNVELSRLLAPGLAAVVGGLAGGLVAAAWTAGSVAGEVRGAARSPMPLDREAEVFDIVDALSELVDREVEERLRLEDEVDELRRRLAMATGAPVASAGETGEEPAAEDATASEGGTRDVAALSPFIDAGFSEDEAGWFRRLQEEHAMARLYLRDRATREGWVNSRRYVEELSALPGSLTTLRQSMDDDTYARYLYAIGRPNQVRIIGVLPDSAARQAGLSPGDVVMSYGEDRLYSARTLRGLTRAGVAGELVPVDVLRDGQRIQAWLPRGPMGVTVTSERALPPEG